jgi:hypothetical protein
MINNLNGDNNMSDALNHLINGELELFKKSINATLYSKVGDALSQRKREIAADMFTEEECSSCGEQMDEGLDPVGKEDSDIDNDGKANTKSDKYLMNRRKVRAKAIKGKK